MVGGEHGKAKMKNRKKDDMHRTIGLTVVDLV
jgi:hypothetical protein